MDVVWTILNTSISVLSVVIFGMLTLYTILTFQNTKPQLRYFVSSLINKYYTKGQLILGITFLAFFFVLFIQELRIVYFIYLLYIVYYVFKLHKEWIPIKVATWGIFFIQVLWSALVYTLLTLFIPFNNIYQVLMVFILIAPLWTIVGIYTIVLPKRLFKK